MHLGLQVVLQQTCELRLGLSLLGGSTASIFPHAEKLLNDTDYQDALAFVAARKKMNRYRSVMDFLYCEVFPEHRVLAFRYYEDKAKQLRFYMDKIVVAERDKVLVLALKIARKKMEAERRESWFSFQIEVLAEARKAA